jgi:hypothetical protein
MGLTPHRCKEGAGCPEFDFEELSQQLVKVGVTPEDFPINVPFQISISGPSDCLEIIFTTYTVSQYAFTRDEEVKDVKAGHNYALKHSLARRKQVTENGVDELFRGEDWIAYISYWGKTKTARLCVAAVTMERTNEIFHEISRTMPVEIEPDDPKITKVNYWHKGRHGCQRNSRNIDVMPWSEIDENYPQVRGMDKLANLKAEDIKGRLILLYGPPGTGKTTFLRAISSEWRSWCSFEVVMDPEIMLNDSSYLQEVMFGDYGSDGDKWHLIVLEDTGELSGTSAKALTGQALSRLLNMTDGILGQGSKVLVALTTNERDDMHEAIVRPGRCLAQLEVSRFSYKQAAEWMAGAARLKDREYTLAELIALRNGESLGEEEDVKVGQYL